MILGIMQPYFFPYLGYFDCIYKSDAWIVFDVVQYMPKSWMTRNRILHPQSGWQYVNVPVYKYPRFSPIKDIVVKYPDAAKERIIGQLQHYRKKAPFFDAVRAVVDEAFARRASDALVDVNLAGLRATCDCLDIPLRAQVFSRMGVDIPPITHPGQWALEVCHALGAVEYVNPPGGRGIFRPEEFNARGIRLGFANLVDYRYICQGREYIEHLSILDVMMWNAPEAINAFLLKNRNNIDWIY